MAARLPGLTVRADNEANLAALAEHWQGVARELEDFVCVFGEVGVGGGIFVDGELFRGAHGFGAEFGHMTVDPAGPPCKCGAAAASRPSRARRRSRAGRHRVGSGGRTRSLTAELVRRAEEGDERSSTACRCRPPSRPWPRVGGEHVRRRRRRARRLLRSSRAVARGRRASCARKRVLSSAWTGCEVRASEFGEGAAVRGAAAATLMSVLAEPWLVADRVGVPRERVS